MEVKPLYDNIIRNIFTINSSIKILQYTSKGVGTNRDGETLRHKIRNIQNSTNKIIFLTISALKKCKEFVKNDQNKRLQLGKLTQTFIEATTIYSDIQRKVTNKIKSRLLKSTIVRRPETSSSLEKAFLNGLFIEDPHTKYTEQEALDITQMLTDLYNEDDIPEEFDQSTCLRSSCGTLSISSDEILLLKSKYWTNISLLTMVSGMFIIIYLACSSV